MNILVVIHEFPPIGGGGGRAAYDICKELVKGGHQVSILTAHMTGMARNEIVDGIRVLRLPSLRRMPYRAPLSAMMAFVLAGLWAGYAFIRKNKPDVIHAHFAVPAGAVAFLLSKLTGVPYLLTAHLGDVPGGVPEKTGKWFRWLEPFTRPIWKHARRIVAVSEYTRQLALRHYPVQIEVIPNGVDVKLHAPAEIILNTPLRLVFAGRFMPQKNPLAIVQILSQLKDLEWRCAMLGDGPLFQEVKREIEKHGMLDRFDLPGWVTPQDVLDWFDKSDILFMPSLSEGLPVVGVQALAKGLALVVSDIGGFLDLVDNEKNGVLVDVQDNARFEGFLRTLLTNLDLILSYRKMSLEKAYSFDISTVSEKYQKIFQEILLEP